MQTSYWRTFPLDDIVVRSGGSGRVVEAYAAIFDTPYEVNDQHGHYMETIQRSAFTRYLGMHGTKRTLCLYNHGMDLRGRPDALASVPLGEPLEVKEDGRGLLTVTRYNSTALADSVLEAVRAGNIRSQSFRGAIYKSSPKRKVQGQPLPSIVRHELGLADYGPTPIPVNTAEMVVAVRSLTDLVQDFAALDEEQRAELIRALSSTTPLGDQETTTTTSTPETGAEDQPDDEQKLLAAHSGRLAIARARLSMELTRRGIRHAP